MDGFGSCGNAYWIMKSVVITVVEGDPDWQTDANTFALLLCSTGRLSARER